MSANEPTSPSSPRVIDRLLRTLSISKTETAASPPLPTDTPQDPPVVPDSGVPVEGPVSDAGGPRGKPESRDTSRGLGRLKSLTRFKKEKKAGPLQGGANAADVPTAEVQGLSIVTEEVALTTAPAKSAPTSPVSERPAPLTIAQRVRELIDILPPVTGKEPLPKPKPVKKGPNGKPIPPAEATPIKDQKFLEQLNSPSIMNGNVEKGGDSVWSLLEALGAPKHDVNDGSGGTGDGDDAGSDWSSVMMYAPLIPTSESAIELADTELRPVTRTLIMEEESSRSITQTLWLSFPWPGRSKPAPPKLVKAWVPSTTKLSIQATWWGYRLYLPPPVLVHLSATEIEVTKRAAMITTALQWMISRLPISLVPLELQPAVLVLQRIAPFLTYIGSFIAWSWATIDGFDKGNGVILSATWLLPIALIPSTWPPPPAPANTGSPSSPTAPPAPPTSPATPAAHTMPSAPASPSPASPASPAAPTTPSAPAPPSPASPSTSSYPTFFPNIFKSKAK